MKIQIFLHGINMFPIPPLKKTRIFTKEIPDFSENGIKEFLLDQLNQRNFSDLQWTAMQTMIDCLDDCGYFKLSLKDFSQWFGIDISTVKYCLDILSSLEPLGIFFKKIFHTVFYVS